MPSTGTPPVAASFMASSAPTTTPEASVPLGYTLVPQPPPLAAYLELRATPGLSPKTPEQAAAGLFGAWFACHVVHDATGAVVAMGRVLGDGGWYFHIIDLATAAEHQRKGLGAAVLARCMHQIRLNAPPGAFITLLADPPGRKLYERFGFQDTAPQSVGMAWKHVG